MGENCGQLSSQIKVTSVCRRLSEQEKVPECGFISLFRTLASVVHFRNCLIGVNMSGMQLY